MVFPDRRTGSVLVTILHFAVALAIVYVARTVFVIFVFSILFAYLINPIVRFLQFLQRHSLFFRNLRGPHVLEASGTEGQPSALAMVTWTVPELRYPQIMRQSKHYRAEPKTGFPLP